MGNPRVVVTLTTLPDRYQTLERTLNSILKQDYPLDAIYLTIPEKAARLDKIYPPLPDSITSKCQIVNIKTDYGPITKIYGALSQESDPKTIIISLDDDVIYPPDLVSSLVKHGQEHKKAAICGTGALLKYGLLFVSMVSSLNFCTWLNPFIGPTITEKGRNIDLVFGVAGVLYRRGFFPSADKLEEELFKYALNNEAVFLNDDILISAYLSKAKIKRKLFKDIPELIVNGLLLTHFLVMWSKC